MITNLPSHLSHFDERGGRRRWTFFDNAFHLIKKQLEFRNIVPLDLTKKTRQLISRRWEIATSASIRQSLEKGTESRKFQKLKLNSSIRSELEAGSILQKKGVEPAYSGAS